MEREKVDVFGLNSEQMDRFFSSDGSNCPICEDTLREDEPDWYEMGSAGEKFCSCGIVAEITNTINAVSINGEFMDEDTLAAYLKTRGAVCPSCGSTPVYGELSWTTDGAEGKMLCEACGLEWIEHHRVDTVIFSTAYEGFAWYEARRYINSSLECPICGKLYNEGELHWTNEGSIVKVTCQCGSVWAEINKMRIALDENLVPIRNYERGKCPRCGGLPKRNFLNWTVDGAIGDLTCSKCGLRWQEKHKRIKAVLERRGGYLV